MKKKTKKQLKTPIRHVALEAIILSQNKIIDSYAEALYTWQLEATRLALRGDEYYLMAEKAGLLEEDSDER